MVAEATGIAPKVLYDLWPPPKELGPPVHRGHAAGVAGQISPARVDGWESALWSTPHALEYLRDKRGLLDETITKYRLGYDSDAEAIVFPVYDAGELARIKLRYLDPAAAPKTINSPGPACLYPDVPAASWLALVAGEIDALTGRQLGLRSISTTCGATLPMHLARQLAGRDVVVLFDVGEELAAHSAVAKLNGLRVHAPNTRAVAARFEGFPHGTDLNDFVVKHGGTREQIIKLINATRRAS